MIGQHSGDPHGGYHFRLVFDGPAGEVPVIQVSGLETAAGVHEIEEGGLNDRVHKRPDQSRWANLVVRFGTGTSRVLQEWRDAFLRDPFDPLLCRSGSILLLDNDGSQVRSYQFVDAWPVSWQGPQLDAGSSELAVEALEIAHEGLVVTSAP